MKSPVWILLCSVFSSLDYSVGSIRSGLLVTSPKQWVNGSAQQVCFTTHSLQNVTVHVTIQGETNNVTSVFNSTSQRIDVEQRENSISSKCVELTLSLRNSSINEVKLSVRANGLSPDNYSFERSELINLRYRDITTFIETDKPIYKPSDTVRFRLLSVRGPEANIVTDQVPLIYIADPSGTRLVQWTEIETSNGLIQLEFPLSSEPPLGTWTIKANVSSQWETATFTVKEYVLPKFEVMIVHPSDIYYLEDIIKWQVCARYTYGEPVIGEVTTTSVCVVEMHWNRRNQRECIQFNNTRLSDGCADFIIDNRTQKLVAGDREVWFIRFNITAQVKEHGTGVLFQTHREVGLAREPLQIDVRQLNRPYFKPGFEYRGKGFLLRADKTPENTVHTVKIRIDNKVTGTFISEKDSGAFLFSVPAEDLVARKNQSVTLQISVDDLNSPIEYLYLNPWYSPSNSFLQIESPDDVQLCNSQLSLPFTYITDDIPPSRTLSFFYQVVARGQIVDSGIISSENLESGGSFKPVTVRSTLTVLVKPVMSTSFDVVVFHVRSDGETVADTARISVDQCFQHQVSLNFAEAKAQPGHATFIRMSADKESLCAVGVVDKSVELMGKSTWLTADKVAKTRETYQTSRSYSDYSTECQPKSESSREGTEDFDDMLVQRPRPLVRGHPIRRYRNWLGGYSQFLDTSVAFQYAGVVTMTDLTLDTRPCIERPWMVYMSYASAARPRFASVPMAGPPGDMRPRGQPMPMSIERGDAAEKLSQQSAPAIHRTYFPETWLWQLSKTGDSNQLNMSVELPHTITEWIGNGYCINAKSGIGVSKPFKIIAFQPFFMSFTLPYSLVRGEIVNIPVTVFNYLSTQCLQVSLKVVRSAAFELKNLDSSSLQSPDSAKLKVCSRQSETHSFRIVARHLGKVNFTVQASSVPDAVMESNSIENTEETIASDVVTRELLVVSEGKEEEYARSVYTCASPSENSSPTSGNWSLVLPDDVIADSVRTRVTVVGDVMGSALSDLDKLLVLPTGCGEQNMLKFAPNIYVLEYLSQSHQLTPEIKQKAIGFLQTGYQRELTYRHNDGSYSAFGNSDPEGSIWLTAFVIRSFARARPFIYIDSNDLVKSIQWIKAQQLENGCFKPVGKVLHKAMTGGLRHDDSLAALTAYIVISLLEADVNKSDSSIVNSFNCVAQQSVDDIYTLSLLSYAYSLYGRDERKRQEIMDELSAKSVNTGGMKHWQSDRQQVSDSSSYYMTSPSAADIEMTSYVMLSMLQEQSTEMHSLVEIVRWLTTQRNAYGGFTSTQDTVLALQALSDFATKIFAAGRNLNLDVVISDQNISGNRCRGRKNCRAHYFSVSNSNRLVQQSVNGDFRLPTSVFYSLNGSGCGFVQVGVKYNRWIASNDQPKEAFVLNVTVHNYTSCKTMKIGICARYNGDDAASNMAVVAVKMVSGWIPDKASVQKLKNDAKLALKRVEIEMNIVNFYFDEFDKTQRCFAFDVLQNIPVFNTKPGLVHIYDYYAPGSSVFANYAISTCTKAPKSASNESRPSEIRTVPTDNRSERRNIRRNNATAEVQCPVCRLGNNSRSIRRIVCDADHVYRVNVTSTTSMKLVETVYSTSSNFSEQLTIKYSLPSRCRCRVLMQGSSLLVITPKPLEPDTPRRRLQLDLRVPGVTLIALQSDDVISCSRQ